MALQVWLPLNGNLNNQGLSDVTINGTPSFSDNGKIGTKCLTSSSTISFNTPVINGSKIWSFCFWGYVVSSSITSNWTGIVHLTDGSSSFRLEVCPLGYVTNNVYCYSTHNNSGYALTTGSISTPSGTNYYDRWVHCCITCDGTTITKYMDGVQVGTCAYNGTGTTTGTLNLINNNKIYKNDVRVYDHCLSDKEVKEISKGLCLHYTLNNPYIESATNICNTNSLNATTCYNGATGKYNYGTSTDIYRDTYVEDSSLITKIYNGTVNLDTWNYVFFDNLTPDVGQYKTLSFDYYPTSQNKINFYSYSTAGNITWKNGNLSGTDGNITVEVNKWNHIEVTIKNTGDKTSGFGYMRIGVAIYKSTTTDYWLFKNIMLQTGDHATGYLSGGVTFKESVECDCTGYGNDGTLVSDFMYDSNTPRYNGCYTFDGSTNYIQVTNPFSDKQQELSINLWVYSTNWNFGRLLSCTEGGGFNVEQVSSQMKFAIMTYTNSAQTSYAYNSSVDSGNAYVGIPLSSISAGWHMFTFVYSATKGFFVYMDGNLISSNSTVTYGIKYANVPLFIGCESNGTVAGPPYFAGKMSDFRIYSTALSANDIKDLYKVGASIDNNNNVYSYEYKE